MKLFEKRLLSGAAALIITAAIAAVVFSVTVGEKHPEKRPTPTIAEKTEFVSDRLREKYEYNGDVVGWIQVPGTKIDEEVLQRADSKYKPGDNKYYLRRNIDEKYDIWGCYFADHKCDLSSRAKLSHVTIIYGHSLKDYAEGPKFSELKKYKKRDFCLENKVITVSTLYEELHFELFAATLLPISLDFIQAEPDSELFKEVLRSIKDNSIQYFDDVKISNDDRILLLQTCTNDDNVRFIIAAKLIDE